MMKAIKTILFILFYLLFLSTGYSQDKGYETKRRLMVQNQLMPRGINDQVTLQAMKQVQRHLFIPIQLRHKAYNDTPLPIGNGQTISQPYIVAYMTQTANLKPGEKVLEIGTGSGYQAAILGEIIDSVYTIEIIESLGMIASKRLKEQGYDKIKTKIADGYLGWPDHAPFDVILVTAAAEYIPPPLIKQLKEGGRMIIPVGSPFQVQQLILVKKKGGKITTKSLFPVRFVPLTRTP